MRLLDHAAASVAYESRAIGRRGRRGQHPLIFERAKIAAMWAGNIKSASIGSVKKIADLTLARHSGRGQSQFLREIAKRLLPRTCLT
jgi:hypothetical protein